MRALEQCSALLFDGSHATAVSRLFTHPQGAWCVPAPVAADLESSRARMQDVLNEIDTAARTGAHIVLSMSYEAAQACAIGAHLNLQIKPQAHPDVGVTPWLQALAFDAPELMTQQQAIAYLETQSKQVTTHLVTPQPTVTPMQFDAAIERTREWIAAGDTYQVNYTFPFVADVWAHSPHASEAALAAIYADWVRDLRIGYGGLFLFPHNSVLSFSPELFVELNGDSLTCRPMKGTAAIGDNDSDTTRRATLLAADSKNRAENLMIVDLMRNDMSQLACTKKVRVPKLFEVKRYGDVLQMTSTVRADLHRQPSLSELFDALFPCGSITGAPKRRTMEIIDALEPHARGAYCGALGYVTPTEQGRFNAVFSVPIRTLETTATPLKLKVSAHRWPVQCNVGAGITFDSIAADEWQECLLKARFFTQHGREAELIETMRVERNGAMPLFKQHMARMRQSAAAFGWALPNSDLNADAVKAWLDSQEWPKDAEAVALRLGVQPDGSWNARIRTLEAWDAPVTFGMYPTTVHSDNPFLQHKSAVRALYNEAMSEAKTKGWFDYVFVNEKGEVTEGARSSIFIKLNGQWLTPPLTSGLLGGIARAELLADETLAASECAFGLDELRQAEEIMLCNALYRLRAQLNND
ncbi:chorismate-binding protein [Hydromonas duriensis]|uniref:Para-aminobenzoate synthetase/4-amino-4-deoxychorismate lyase n=1 Tax=Hydromonas duriensis TaxID=1527608 RepID=A0A4V3DJZ3_9BURK|nr:chorismate-binding protein [Hydromonas duriensis]TDR32045.1 para-aminobenzoate synthetase/4-amino-4-deoxychorismate lyase [Hydromonas duriensis]